VTTLIVFAVLAVAANWRFGLDDGRTEERTRMVLWLIGQQRFAEADTRVAEIERASPTPGVLHFRVGRALLAERQYDSAIGHLQRAAEIDPGQPETDYALGQALLDASRPQEALPHLRRAYDAGVRADLAGYDLARALGMTGDRAQAVSVLSRVRPRQAGDARSWFTLGELAAQLQAPELVETFMREAVRLQPGAPDPHEQLGLALAAQGRFEDALGELQQAARLNPSDAVAQLNLAVALARLGREDEARTHAEAALRIRPDYDRARQFLEALSRQPPARK
jgi:tetratricopeptide (TPR) repeat protein